MLLAVPHRKLKPKLFNKTTYFISLLDIADFLSVIRIVGGKRLSTDRIHPFIVNKDLEKKACINFIL